MELHRFWRARSLLNLHSFFPDRGRHYSVSTALGKRETNLKGFEVSSVALRQTSMIFGKLILEHAVREEKTVSRTKDQLTALSTSPQDIEVRSSYRVISLQALAHRKTSSRNRSCGLQLTCLVQPVSPNPFYFLRRGGALGELTIALLPRVDSRDSSAGPSSLILRLRKWRLGISTADKATDRSSCR
ncbi:hypothetical protein K474DRAFT_1191556 [Panus rudis PR-1116 ss-1]|nr:hypothetical protein K474DRAFT_1191556 [Panus rudis PR-1116 ss-1]